jgi:hypothetical protein
MGPWILLKVFLLCTGQYSEVQNLMVCTVQYNTYNKIGSQIELMCSNNTYSYHYYYHRPSYASISGNIVHIFILFSASVAFSFFQQRSNVNPIIDSGAEREIYPGRKA